MLRLAIISWICLSLAHTAKACEISSYLADVKLQAMAAGVSEQAIDDAFRGVTLDERVIGFDRRQPEFVHIFADYLQARVSDFRRQEGRRLLLAHRELLTEIQALYGVEPEYIVAFWGLETSFGRYQGKYDIIRSLVTLGHDQRRSAFFTAELIHALKILDEGHVAREEFVGAWAGAMGQAQFMPSSFLRFAVDHDGDGKKNIWKSEADVFASIANYLVKAGWKPDLGWGSEVRLPDGNWQVLREPDPDPRCRGLKNHTRKLSLAEWQEKGIHADVRPGQKYALILPQPGDEVGYLVGGNIRAILDYNCANKYAVSVGLLADYIAGR